LLGSVARLVVALDLEVAVGVAVDQRLELPVLGAALAQVHAAGAGVQLGGHRRLADRADRSRELEQHLVARGRFGDRHGFVDARTAQ